MANLVAIDRSNTGEVVGRLEERGLLRRASGDADRRTKRLYLTEAGAALVKAMTPDLERAQERMLEPLRITSYNVCYTKLLRASTFICANRQ